MSHSDPSIPNVDFRKWRAFVESLTEEERALGEAKLVQLRMSVARALERLPNPRRTGLADPNRSPLLDRYAPDSNPYGPGLCLARAGTLL